MSNKTTSPLPKKRANAQQLVQEKRYLFVDFENTQDIDLGKTPGNLHIFVFVGANQKSMSIDLAISNQKLGSRLEWKRITRSGKNALDFYIAYYLGKILEKHPAAECFILSKDQGFDAMIATLEKEGKKIQRIGTLADIL